MIRAPFDTSDTFRSDFQVKVGKKLWHFRMGSTRQRARADACVSSKFQGTPKNQPIEQTGHLGQGGESRTYVTPVSARKLYVTYFKQYMVQAVFKKRKFCPNFRI